MPPQISQSKTKRVNPNRIAQVSLGYNAEHCGF